MKRSLLALALFACTSDSQFDEAAARMAGIYQVTSFTLNQAACAPGGESLLGGERFAVVTTQEGFGGEQVTAISCASVADCRDKLAALESGDGFVADFLFSASSVGDGGALVGQGVSSGFPMDGVCVDGELTATTFALDGTTLRIEQAITVADDHPVDGDGFCTTDATVDAARDRPCGSFSLLTAERVDSP